VLAFQAHLGSLASCTADVDATEVGKVLLAKGSFASCTADVDTTEVGKVLLALLTRRAETPRAASHSAMKCVWSEVAAFHICWQFC